MSNFALIFGVMLLLNAGVTFRSSDMWKTYVLKEKVAESTEVETATKKKWEGLLKRYLLVYLLATLSDW